MHVLILPTRYPNWYNQESNIFFKDQAEALASQNTKVSILALIPITIQDILRKKTLKFGLEIIESKGITTYRYLFPVPPKSKWIQQIIRCVVGKYLLKKYILKDKIPDVVHVHTFIAANLAIHLKTKYNIPYVITEHSSIFLRGLATNYDIKLAQKAFQSSNRNIAVSQNFKHILEDLFKSKFVYIPNVVDTNFFRPTNVDKYRDFTILNIANLNPNKNQKLLISSFSKIHESFPNIKLRIGGEGPERENLNSLILELGLEEEVTLLGKLTRSGVLAEMQQSHVFALTSKFETFGVVLVEAMACGVPVISTKCGGAESIVESNVNGILIEETLFDKGLTTLIENYSTYDSKGIVLNVEKQFSNTSVISQLLTVYKDQVIND